MARNRGSLGGKTPLSMERGQPIGHPVLSEPHGDSICQGGRQVAEVTSESLVMTQQVLV